MIRTKLLISLIFLTLASMPACKSKTVVKKLVNNNASISNKSETKKIDGVMYHLPKTVVQVTVPVKKTTQSTGEFALFAPCFFPVSDYKKVPTERTTEFSIDPATFSSRGVPDTDQTYVLETKGKYFESKTLFVEYAPGSYVLQKGESESKNETLEFTVKAIATAAGIASKVVPLLSQTGPGVLADDKRADLVKSQGCFKKMVDVFGGEWLEAKIKEKAAAELLKPPPAERILELKRQIGTIETAKKLIDQIESLLTGKSTYKIDSVAEEEFLSTYQRAKDAFARFQGLQTQREDVLNGSNPNIPPDTFKLMLEKNDEAIKAYRATFLGAESEKLWAATFEFTPKESQSNSPLIFSFSKEKGVCRNGQILSRSISIGSGFEDTKCKTSADAKTQALWISVKKTTDQTFLDNIAGANTRSEEADGSRGWYYRVPADSDVSLQSAEVECGTITKGEPQQDCSIPAFTASNGRQLAVTNMQIAQLGVTASVPATMAGRSHTTSIGLDPATGAMKNFKTSSTALIDKTILDEAGKAANSAVDAADPLTRKKRELEELQIKNQIIEERKKLANSNTTTTNDDDGPIDQP